MRVMLRNRFITTIAILLVLAPLTARALDTSTSTATGGMVVSVNPEASDAGAEMLRRGGTAVDAAVATALALAVTFPEAGNIGGGGFMMVGPPGEPPVCIEYRETAPAAANRDTFINHKGMTGHRVVGVPGTVRGMELAHKKFGKLPWRDVVMPAVRLAEEGFQIDAVLARNLNRMVAQSKEFPEFCRVYSKPDGSDWKQGDRLVQPDLARTMRILADEGPDAFYTGSIAKQLVAEMEAGGGLITMADLAAYRANVREPIHGTFRGYDVYGPPPPSSGGTCLVMMLNMLETFDLRSEGRFSPLTMHRITEVMRRAYADRARYLGDPAFTEIPPFLTTKEYARSLAESIDPERATPSSKLGPEITLAKESPSTTHFSVIDGNGMAVSNTYTLQQSYGSRVVVRGAGFLLNNEMTDFNLVPGVTDRNGRIGTDPNTVAPGKRMLSSQCPTLVYRDGKIVLLTGSPGGRTIINTSLCVVLNVLEFDMGIREAVDAPRMHHQWWPDRLSFEGDTKPEFASLMKALAERGHHLRDSSGGAYRQGDAHSILCVDGKFTGAADLRRTKGKAAGVEKVNP